MREKRILYGILALAVFFLLANPVMVNGVSYKQAIDGPDYSQGEPDAYHPEIDSYESNVVMAYVKEKEDPDLGRCLSNIRIAISTNSGVNWNLREWVFTDTNRTIREYPDVHVVYDYTESGGDEGIIVVWQEKPADDSSDWVIKARERTGFGVNDTWQSVHTISVEDDEADKYPKIDTFSQSGGSSETYWNVVWQHHDDGAGSWGIQLDTYKKDSSGGSWMQSDHDIKSPIDSNEEYTHPAVACNYQSSSSCEVHIVYDSYDSSDSPAYSVEVTTGDIINSQPNHVYSAYTPPRTTTIDSATSDADIGYPDISSRMNESNSEVWVVWRKVTSSYNEVMFRESVNGGQTYPLWVTVTSWGPTEALRCVAIAADEQNGDKISVVWTYNNNVYHRNRTFNKSTNDWKWHPQVFSVTTGVEEENFVDVSIYKPNQKAYSHICWQRFCMSTYYGRD